MLKDQRAKMNRQQRTFTRVTPGQVHPINSPKRVSGFLKNKRRKRTFLRNRKNIEIPVVQTSSCQTSVRAFVFCTCKTD